MQNSHFALLLKQKSKVKICRGDEVEARWFRSDSDYRDTIVADVC